MLWKENKCPVNKNNLNLINYFFQKKKDGLEEKLKQNENVTSSLDYY